MTPQQKTITWYTPTGSECPDGQLLIEAMDEGGNAEFYLVSIDDDDGQTLHDINYPAAHIPFEWRGIERYALLDEIMADITNSTATAEEQAA